jgi:hypothetical protein
MSTRRVKAIDDYDDDGYDDDFDEGYEEEGAGSGSGEKCTRMLEEPC